MTSESEVKLKFKYSNITYILKGKVYNRITSNMDTVKLFRTKMKVQLGK